MVRILIYIINNLPYFSIFIVNLSSLDSFQINYAQQLNYYLNDRLINLVIAITINFSFLFLSNLHLLHWELFNING